MSSAFADGAEVEPEGLGLRDNFVLSGDQIDYFYKVGILTCVEPATTISCIGVCAVDDRALVALPDAAWHRLKKSRKLPSDALQRAVHVAVQPCTPDEREAASGAASLHVWLGLLAPAYEDQVEYDETKPADIDFPMEDDGTTVLPYAGALIAVCKDHFTFLSAESDLGGQGLESRMGSLSLPVEGSTVPTLWPMPLPFPEMLVRMGPESSALPFPVRALQKMLNLVVAALSWLHMGRPAKAPAAMALRQPLSSPQWGGAALRAAAA